MSDTIILRLQVSPEDLRKAGYDVSKIGEKPITLKLPQKPLGDLPEQAKFAEGTVGALREKMKKLNDEIEHLKDAKAIKQKQDQIEELGREVDQLTGKMKAVPSAPGGGGDITGGMMPQLTKATAQAGALAIAFGVAKGGFERLVEQDTAMADLQAMTGLTRAEVEQLTEKATDLSNEFGTGVVQNIDAMKTVISKFGPEVANSAEDLDSMTRSINVLSKTSTGLADTSKTAEILANTVNAFGLSAADAATKAQFMARATDVLAAGAQAGAIEADQISEALLKTGSTMSATNVSLEEGVAAIEVLGLVMANGAENGNALKNVQLKLQEGRFLPPDTSKALKAAGVDIAKLSDNSLSFSDRLSVLKPLVNDTALLTKMFGTENVVAAQHLIKNVEQIKKMTEAVSEEGAALKQAEINMNAMQAKWDKVNRFFENSVTKYLKPFVDSLAGIVDAIEKIGKGDIVDGAVDALEGLFGVFGGGAILKGATDLLGITGGTQKAGAAAKGAKKDLDAMGTAAQKTAKMLELPTVEIVKTKGELEKLKGAPAGSLAALEENARKLEEAFRKMRTNSPRWFDAKEGVRQAREDIALITSGAAEQFGNDLTKLRAYIKMRAQEEGASPIEKALLGEKVDDKDLQAVKLPSLSENLDKELEKFSEQQAEVVKAAQAMGEAFGLSMADGIASGQPVMKVALKAILELFLTYLEKKTIMAVVGATLDEVMTKGLVGFLTAAAATAGISTVFNLAKAAVKGFATGGIIVGERGPEVIAPAKEFSEFAGSIVSGALGIMQAAMTKLNDMEMSYRRIDVNSNVQFNQARVAIEGNQLVAYLNAHSYREQRGSLGW